MITTGVGFLAFITFYTALFLWAAKKCPLKLYKVFPPIYLCSHHDSVYLRSVDDDRERYRNQNSFGKQHGSSYGIFDVFELQCKTNP